MSTMLTYKSIKTRKDHRCYGCKTTIPAGTIAKYSTVIECGDFYSSYWCKACTDWADAHCRGCRECDDVQEEGCIAACRDAK